MVTLGSPVDTNGWILTGCNLEDQVNVDVGLLDDWRVGDWTVNELIDNKDRDDVCIVVDDWMVGGSDGVDDKIVGLWIKMSDWW